MNTTTATTNNNNNLESYPPPFRLRKTAPADGDDLTESTKQDCPIPVIDFQCLIRDNKEEDYKNCDDKKKKLGVGEACRDWGVFRLVNHGVPPDLLNKVQDFAREIFSLPFETKQGLFTTTPLSYFWGTPALTPSGAALSRSPQNINWVEGLNVPLTQLSQLQLQPQPHDQHPSLISFRLLLEEYGRHLGRLATAIFEAMSKELNMDITDEYSKPHLSESTGFIRVYRYPPNSDEEKEEEEGGEHTAWGMDVHTDSSVLSILNQDQVGGLEVLKDDQWFTVKPVSNTLVVNLGDMMQAISNDEYKSVKHRVKVNRYKERVSTCYFVFPGEGSVIKSSKYKPFTYSDFRAQVQQDVKALGYKVGLERFKITSTANTISEAC